jgi:glycosyltransferase involved in cell wall biosynthesis
MPESVTVTVVIPAYNGERYVADAVTSAIRQTHPALEIIVVNDGSTDETGNVLAGFGGRIRVVSQANKGLSAARNAGIQGAKGQWIGLLDADDTWRPKKLEYLVAEIQKEPSAGIIFSAVHHWWEDGTRHQERHRRTDRSCERIFDDLISKNVILGGGSGALVRKACFDEVGLFDETLSSSEDWDMWIRIASRYKVRYVDEVLVDRRERHDSLSQCTDRMLENDLRVLAIREAGLRQAGVSKWQLRQAKASVYCRAGVSFFCSGQTDKARQILWQALRQGPFMPNAWVPMLKILLGIRHRDKAP